MRWLLAVLVVSLVSAAAAQAQPASKFELMIFPLECHVDTLQTGSNTIFQVTPENCMNPPFTFLDPLGPGLMPWLLPGEQAAASPQQHSPQQRRGSTAVALPLAQSQDLPQAFGHDSVVVQEAAFGLDGRAFEVGLYAILSGVFGAGLLSLLAVRVAWHYGVLPVVFHWFRRRPKLRG